MNYINKSDRSSKDDNLNELTDKLIQKFSPQCIICFNETVINKIKKGCFTDLTDTAIHHFLLMIVTTKEEYPGNEVWNYIKQNFPDRTVTILTHREEEIIDRNNVNRHFFGHVFRNGVFLFRKKDLNTSDFPSLSLHEISHSTLLTSTYTIEMAQTFRDFAELNLGKGRNNLLPFMFNQSILYACAALFYVFMNYKANMYDLEWMIGLTTCFAKEPAELMHTYSPQEKELFNILQNEKYDSDYEIDNYDAHYLFVKVMTFIEMTELLCQKKMNERLTYNNRIS